MKIKILKIFRENKTIEDIESKLKIVTQEKFDDSTIDSILERKIDLGVQFNISGIKLNIATPTYIFLEENKLGTTLICKSNVIKRNQTFVIITLSCSCCSYDFYKE